MNSQPATVEEQRVPKKAPVCPECGSARLQWSRTRWWELLMRVVFIRAYRCRSCRYRGYLLKPLFGPPILLRGMDLKFSADR
jgi:DNA-directed RNA polymerase subunit RPC12/RpoP